MLCNTREAVRDVAKFSICAKKARRDDLRVDVKWNFNEMELFSDESCR